MSFITGLLSGSKGANFEAQGANQGQANNAYDQTQDAIQKQKEFLNAVTAANGVGNQSQVYNQLQGVVNGTGPNPAQAMLDQATGNNVANQAAIAAGVRGASANPGLIARQAANTGAQIQQNAAGQGATMEANQSLNALGQAGQIAGNQVGQQAGAVGAYNAATQGQQDKLLNSISNQNNANGQIAAQNAKGQGNVLSGITSAAGSFLGLAEGGEVPAAAPVVVMAPAAPKLQPLSNAARMMRAQPQAAPSAPPPVDPMETAGKNIGDIVFGGVKALGNAVGIGPKAAPAPITNEFTGADGIGGFNPYANADGIGGGFAKGGSVGSRLKGGGKVPGQAKVAGNSYANDTISAKLSPGEVVIPRSVMQSADPVSNAAKFVAACMAKSGGGSRKRRK